jgi:tRNA(Leu) C34 or U34 (ribose-2'-O)-methylase TrmL
MQRDEGTTPAIFLTNPKYPHNVGGIVRIASCFGVNQLWWTGTRVTLDPSKGRLPREERMKGYASVKLFPNRENGLDSFPKGTTPVGIELVKGAQLLPRFEHPDNPVYVFGPEDGSIPQGIRRLCHSFVAIPTHHCLNLSNAVSLVLYDRLCKQMAKGEVSGWTMDDFLRESRGDTSGWFNNDDPACGIEGLQGDETRRFQSVGSAR